MAKAGYWVGFVPLNELLLEDNEKVKELKTLYKKEGEYAGILGPIEYAIAQTYLNNRKLKDKEVVKALKNIKSNYLQEMSYFREPIEQEIMLASSIALRKRKITKREYRLAISYVLWAIDNRSYLPSSRAYLDWLLNFFGLMNKKEKQALEKSYDDFGKKHGMEKEVIEEMKLNFSEHETDSQEEELTIKESEKFSGTGEEEQISKVLQLKIFLNEIKPQIWRRFLVKDSISFQKLHDIIQTVMGWQNYHLFEFRIGNETITCEEEGHNMAEASFKQLFKSPEFMKMLAQQDLNKGSGMLDMNKVNKILKDTEKNKLSAKFDTSSKIGELLQSEGQEFNYNYDFGDNWEHTLILEKIVTENNGQKIPACLEGARACPPEDCGGGHGYQEFLKAISDKNHPEHEEMLGWIGGSFDQEKFDLGKINKLLSKVR